MPPKIEQDDLSLEANANLDRGSRKVDLRQAQRRSAVFRSHPDFMTFAPDGPLRQITIPQMRLLKDRAPLKPLQRRLARVPDRFDRPRQ